MNPAMLDDLKTQFGSSIRTVRRFLQRPISVRGGSVTLGVPASSLRAEALEGRRARVRRMRRELYELMEQHGGSRQLMRHLDLVERTLRASGYRAVDALPVRVLAMALAQLERLVWDWTPEGLAELRSRLSLTVKARQADARQEPAPSAVDLEITPHHAADVTEVEHSQFEEMQRSWAGQLPPGAASAIAEAKAAA